MRETGVWSLGQEDPLEKETATHSSILAWRIPGREEPGRLHSPWGREELELSNFTFFHFAESASHGKKPSSQVVRN